jgi:hypothetical protein
MALSFGVVSACGDGTESNALVGGTGASSGTGSASGGGGAGAGNSSGTGVFDAGASDANLNEDSACAQQEGAATLVNKPVDIIFVIDNSGSMAGEIEEVEEEVANNFVNIIEAATPAIDYRVIMVSDFGFYDSSNSKAICIAAPLGARADGDVDHHCDDVTDPPGGGAINAARYFHHSVFITSHNALCRLIQQYSTADEFGLQPTGYQEVLRPEAFKVFVAISDDRPSDGQQDGCNAPIYDDQNMAADGVTMAAQWDADLRALSAAQFGTDQDRNYVFHSIVALAPFDANDLSLPHPSTAPIVTAECSPGAENPGTGYQALSVLTGGLRYPSCGLDYTPIFQKIAEGVIAGAQVDCEFAIPDPPLGQTIDLDTVVVRYEPGDGSPSQDLNQVPDAGTCMANAYYIEGDLIKLCPEACTIVKADDAAQMKVLFGCVGGAN